MDAPGPPLSIAHVDAETGFSGGEVQVFLLMEGLRARGHAGVLLAPPGSRAESEARARDLAVRGVAMRGDLDVGAIAALVRELDDIGPDLVHLHTGRATWLGGIAARLVGIPAITTRRMDRPVARSWRTRLVYGALVRCAVAISPAVAERLCAGGVDERRVRTIASAVDPAALRSARPRDEVRAELELARGEPALLALAALVPRKGLDVAIDALARLAGRGPAPALLIAGEGPEREALAARAAARGLDGRVRLLGRRADKAELLAACDVVVVPSRREGLGVAALEAMAAGRPVVASRVGGLSDALVDGETGLLVAPEDPAALADALARLLADDELRARLGAAGPARIDARFRPERMVAAYEALYREVLAEGGRS